MKKNVKRLIFSVIFTFLVLSTASVFLFFYKNEFVKFEILSGKGTVGQFWEINAAGGQYESVKFIQGEKYSSLRGPRNALISNKAMYGNQEIIYDIFYKYDEYGRRISTEAASNSSQITNRKFAAFFGCSDLLGLGVSAEDTISYLFEKSNNTYHSYNYGYVGTAPNYVLRILETSDLKTEIPEEEGFIFYVMTEGHYPKTLARPFTIVRPEMPVYNLENENLVFKGSLEEISPVSTYFKKMLAGSHLAILLGGTFITEGMRYKKAERDFICQTLDNAKTLANKQKPNAEFVIVLHTLLPWDDRGRIRDCAIEKKISYIDIEVPYQDNFVTDPVYFHPSKTVNQLVAQHIHNYIEKKGENLKPH